MISDTSLASRPVINLVQGHAHDVVDQAIKVISNPAVGIYARGSMLVRVVPHKSPAGTLTLAKQAENVHRPEGSVAIVEVKESSLAEALTRHATFQKWNAKMQPEARNCPVEVARMILDRKGAGWDAIPRLRGVIHAPTLRPDHSVISEPGYDPASGLLFCSDRIWQQQPASPTKQDGKRALEYLARPLSGFPFVSDADRAAALALLITAVLRPALKTAPMFCVTAPAAGTGKSLLVDLASILSIGRTAAVMTPTPDDGEMEKRLGAILLAGDNVLNIDNVSHPLKSDFLCQALTQDEMQVRVLGLSKTARISPTALIAATGNNLSLVGDLNRRVVQIRLDARCERPDAREFDFDATKFATANRMKLATAALTVVRSYLACGTPPQVTAFGSFQDWSDTVRSALIWLGLPDCLGDVDAMRAEDPEKAELRGILESLPRGRFTAKEIVAMTAGDADLREALEGLADRSGKISSKRLGRYFLRHQRVVIGGRWIEPGAHSKNGTTWRVNEISAAKAEPSIADGW